MRIIKNDDFNVISIIKYRNDNVLTRKRVTKLFNQVYDDNTGCAKVQWTTIQISNSQN